MKRVIVFALLFFILIGCSQLEPAEEKEVVPETFELRSGEKIEIDNSLKETLDRFVSLFEKEDFDGIYESYSEETKELIGKTKIEVVRSLEETFEHHNIDVKGYRIDHYEEYKQNKHYVNLVIEMDLGEGEMGEDHQRWIVKKEKGQWKMDASLVYDKRELSIEPIYVADDLLVYHDFTFIKKVDGYLVEATVHNVSERYKFVFGKEGEKTVATLETTEGEYEMTVKKDNVLSENGTGTTSFFFEGAEGDAKSLTLTNVFKKNQDGLYENSYFYELPLN